MKKQRCSLLPMLLGVLLTSNNICHADAADPVDYVNTLIGTMSNRELSAGNTYPAVSMPWGMNTWTPMTGQRGDGWTYTYTANKLTGLKLTHQPSPWINDYGALILMPFSGAIPDDPQTISSWFSHKAEHATPYYYKVYLADYDITAELAPTERACILRLNYPKDCDARLLIDALDGGEVEVSADGRHITGYSTMNSGGVPDNFRMHFIITPDCPFTLSNSIATLHTTGSVTIRVAASFISTEQAALNMQELGSRTLDEVAHHGRARWNDILSRISVQAPGTPMQDKHLSTFYSCLYRCLLFPRALYETDADGHPVHYSPYNGQVLPGKIYTDTGFWDTFRALFPLLNLVYPERAAEIQEGLLNTYRESGFLPEWASPGHRDCMVGNNSASVVADAYLSGILPTDSTAEALWQAVIHGANTAHPTISSTGRLGYEYYNRLGYIPCDVGINESVARTLEYAYDDWCIYKLGCALGKSTNETAVYAQRAMNYRNLFDSESRLMRGRNHDGTFQSPFNPYKWGDAYTEGNAWHYTWSVFHDPAGLATLMGGSERMAEMLDSLFIIPPLYDDSYYGYVIHEIREMQIMNMGNYAHGNQPVQHLIYLYNWVRQPWKTQQRVRQVMERFYSPTPDGYCGDEDNGQTSAWYVFSALGFYPVCPGSGEYALGSPLFSRISINDSTLITTTGSGPYIQSMTADGKTWNNNYITLEMLRKGYHIHFDMSDKPNLERGTHKDNSPHSFSEE